MKNHNLIFKDQDVYSMFDVNFLDKKVDLPDLSDSEGNFSKEFLYLLSIGAVGLVAELENFPATQSGLNGYDKILFMYKGGEDFDLSDSRGLITHITNRSKDNYLELIDLDDTSDKIQRSCKSLKDCVKIVAIDHCYWSKGANTVENAIKNLKEYKEQKDCIQKQIDNLQKTLLDLEKSAKVDKEFIKYSLDL